MPHIFIYIDLTFSGTGSESELLSASVDIPSSQICPSDIDNFSSSADENEDLYYYLYDDICGSESYCEYNDYYYYDLLNLFDDCAKVLKVSEGIRKNNLFYHSFTIL